MPTKRYSKMAYFPPVLLHSEKLVKFCVCETAAASPLRNCFVRNPHM
jgi:hypothetical protein